KAIAFFIVDIANLALLSALCGYQIPFTNIHPDAVISHLNLWRAGSAPFALIQFMMICYVLYSQYDAYRDAAASIDVKASPDLGLSQMTCASYVLHLGSIFAICFFVLLNITHQCKPAEMPQIQLSFELEEPTNRLENQGKTGIESSEDAKAHSKDAPKDEVKPSDRSAEMSASKQADSRIKPSADETNAVASKQIDTPAEKQTPKETFSLGSAIEKSKATYKPSEETQASTNIAATSSEDTINSNNVELVESEQPSTLKPKLIAQLPLSNTVASSMSASQNQVEESSASSVSTVTQSSIETQTLPTKQNSPSMLGFMDSTLSNDADMRLLWSEMSSTISHYVADNPLQGSGTAVCSFTLAKDGRITNMQTLPANNEFASSLAQSLNKMPRLQPPAKQLGKMFFDVKASNDGSATFVSLEISSQASEISEESLSSFKYQTTLQAYLKGIKKQIYSSWKPPVKEGVKPVMVGFTVTTDGKLTKQHVVESSGDPKADAAALHAALSVSQWVQPPAGTSEDLDVCMVIQKCKNCDAELKQQGANAATGPALLAK
ncbi:MAG: TonB family protein, partial [Candidatus Obscuribacterales bacterium]|nr:TonB family protein [Candidatus Obscuribacterales bacterium]